jgi:hypothetical protein
MFDQVSVTARAPSTSNRRDTWRKRSFCTKEVLKTIFSMVMGLYTGQVTDYNAYLLSKLMHLCIPLYVPVWSCDCNFHNYFNIFT